MKLFSKEVDRKLFKQYPKGADMENQMVVAKIFNPYGRGRWYLMNSDPDDPEYIWGIVQMGDIVEMGSISRKQLESARVKPFNLPLERDLYYSPRKASEVYRGLMEGKFFDKGGNLENKENKDMVLNRAEALEHHADELEAAAKKADHIPAWVVAKVERASSDLSDTTHYLDGENEIKEEEMEGEEMASGGLIAYANDDRSYEIASFNSKDSAKKFAKANKYKYETITFEDEKGDNIVVSREDKFSDIDWLFSNQMANGGKLEVGKYYKNKEGKNIRYVGTSSDPEKGAFTDKEGNFLKVSYDEIMAKGGQISGNFKLMPFKREGNIFVSTTLKGVSPENVMVKGVEGKLKGDDYKSAEYVATVILQEHEDIDRVDIIKKGASVLKDKKVGQITRESWDKNRYNIEYFEEGGKTYYFQDFYEWSQKEVKKSFDSEFDEGFPIVKFVKDSGNNIVESAFGLLENGKNVIFDVDKVEWKIDHKMAKGGKITSPVTFGKLEIGKEYYQVVRPELGIEKIKITKKENSSYSYFTDKRDHEVYVSKYQGRFNDNEELFGIYIDKEDAKRKAIEILEEKMSKYAKGGKIGQKIKFEGKEGEILNKKGDMYFVEVKNYHPNGDTLYTVLRESEIEKMAKGGETKSEEVVYIEYRNAKKGFAKDKKYFKGDNAYTDAVKWGKKNLGNFNMDMVKFEMAKGGGIYSSDNLYILTVSKEGKEVGEERFRAKNMSEAREMGEEFEEKYKSKHGGDLSFSVKQAMAEGGSIDEKKYRKKLKEYGFKPYGKTKGIYTVKYLADGLEAEEKWETKEMAMSAASRYSSPLMSDTFKDVKVYDENGKEVKFEKGDVIKVGYMARGGETDKKWIQKAINPKKRGALRADAKRLGLIKGDEPLSMSDLKKLEAEGGKVAQRARLAMRLRQFKDGGEVKFKDKVEAVKKSLLKRKKVPKAVQKDYGKTFSPKEAEDSAKRIVGAQTYRERILMRIAKGKKK